MSGFDSNSLRARCRDLEVEVDETTDSEQRVSVPAANALALLARLREGDEFGMKRLVDLTAIDRGQPAARFEVVYRLQSIDGKAGIRVHARIDETGDEDGAESAVIDSVTSVWPAANWLEREVFDLFGIRFRGHPDLRRLLLDEAFEGAPLRKDHPLRLERPLPLEGSG